MTAPEERFRALFAGNYCHLLAYALRRTTSRADAEDVVAEAFTVAWRRLDVVPDDDHEQRLWLYGVARRTLANHRRGVGRAHRLSLRLGSETLTVDPPSARFEQAADVAQALHAMAHLPETDQELLRLALWEELSHADIAKVTGTSVANVAVRLHRAKRKLRVRFERSAQGLPDGGQVLAATRATTAEEPTR